MVLPAEDRSLPTRQYLHRTKNRPTAQCWWCRRRTQTRGHLFKVCPEWKAQQRIPRAKVWKEAGKGESQFNIRDLLADGRCSQAVLDPLSTTDVGRLVPAEGNVRSEWGHRERREREEKRRVEAGDLDAGEELPLFLPTPSSMVSVDE